MKIIINNLHGKHLETISLENLDNINEIFQKFSKNGPLEVKILVINESLCSYKLSKFKNNFDKLNVSSLCIYSNNREAILTGKSLKIDSIFVKEPDHKNKILLGNSIYKQDIFHKGTVRSGDRISSNGNLCIIGDVNPGAIIYANKNIYVWGKLLGIAFAGKGGNKNAHIASLYLNPLQLRIADVVAIGPKEKPKTYYPEIALVEEEAIIINPYLVESMN